MRKLVAAAGLVAALALPVGLATSASAAPAKPAAPANIALTVLHGAGVWSEPSNASTGVGLVNAGDQVSGVCWEHGQYLSFSYGSGDQWVYTTRGYIFYKALAYSSALGEC